MITLELNDFKKKITEVCNSIDSTRYHDISRYQDDIYSISELIYCLAKAYHYRVLKEQPVINGKMLSGALFHQLLPQLLDDYKDKLQFEVECSKDYNDYKIVGHADAVDEDTVYEFKYTAAKLNNTLPFYYYMQANAYAVMLDKPYYKVVMVNSYSLDVVAIDGAQDKDAFSFIEKQAEDLHDAIKTRKVPKGPMYKWECSHCQFRNICPNRHKEVLSDEGFGGSNDKADKGKSGTANET